MKNATAKLTNSINIIGFRAFNHKDSINREDILSTYAPEVLDLVWSIFSRFVQQNYQAGKGTTVKGLGTFTFTNMEYSLEGTTNQYNRDVKTRLPVFIVSNEFLETLKPGQYTKTGGLIYYTQKINNSISIIKLNYAEMAIATGIPKEEFVTVFINILKDMSQNIQMNQFENRELPGVGVFVLKANVFGMKFLNDFNSSVKLIPQKLIHTKKNIDLYMDLNNSNGARAQDISNIEKAVSEIRPKMSVLSYLTQNGEKWLKDKHNIDVTQIKDDKKILDNGDSKIRFCGKTFYKGNTFTNFNTPKTLKDINLPMGIISAMLSNKGQLIKEMKSYDRKNNGIISRFELIRAFSKANLHYSLSTEVITDIINLYAKDIDYIDYFKLVTYLLKDIKILLEKEDNKTENELFNSFNKKYKLGPQTLKTLGMSPTIKSYSSLSSSMNQVSFNTLSGLANYDMMTVPISEVMNEIKAIKMIIPNIMIKNKETLNDAISFINLNNILHEYSMTYTTDKILKILKFIRIENPNSFTLNLFENKMSQCKVTSYEMTHEDLLKAYEKFKDEINSKGGKNLLFKGKESISFPDFLLNLQGKTNYSDNILTNFFEKMTGTNDTFTQEDYMSKFVKPKDHLTKEFAINSLRMINKTIQEKKTTINQYFNHLLAHNLCRRENTLGRQNFINAIQLESSNFTPEEIDYLFTQIDANQDNLIDRNEFINAVKQDYNALTKMQDIIKKMKLDVADMAYRFEIHLSEPPIQMTFFQFKEKMRKFDYTYTNEFIEGLFYDLTKGCDVLYSNILLNNFNVFKKEHFRTVNNDTFKLNFIQNIQNQVDFHTLKSAFEDIDKKFSGRITKDEFCKVITRFTQEFRDEDIMKFVRINNLNDSNYNVNYPDFINLIFYNAKLDLFLVGVDILKQSLMTECNKSLHQLILKINKTQDISNCNSHWVSFDALFSYIKEKEKNIDMKVIAKFDLDSDGKISTEDLNGIIERYVSTSFFKYENSENANEVNLYAGDVLTEDKFKQIVKEIKTVIKKKNVTEIGLFKKLDENHDGFISNHEFNKNINQVVTLAPSVKDKVFNYLDYYHNGLIDLQTFLLRFKEFKSNEIIVHNNNTIERVILASFGSWISKNNQLSDTEIMAILDKDADGIVSLIDFRSFVLDVLRISIYEFNDYKLERVMQTISLTKNKNIGLADIKEFINRTNAGNLNSYFVDLKETFKETTNQNLSKNKENTEWITQAIERFGLFISERFENIEHFYNLYCDQQSKKFKLENFNTFHHKNFECFYGFNLTQDELLDIFTSLDSQKKNYLIIEDFQNKINLFDFYKKMHFDIKQFLQQNFPTNIDAFKFFLSIDVMGNECLESILSKKDFFDGLNYLFPKKYSTETILRYLRNYFNADDTISYSKFSFIYYDKIIQNESIIKERGKMSMIKTTRDRQFINARSLSSSCRNHPFKIKDHFELKTPFDVDPLEKLKRIISSSTVDYANYIKMNIMLHSKGIVNHHEFKNILKSLNLGLTILEIEDIVSKCGKTRDGFINLKEFLKFITSEDKSIAKAKNVIHKIVGDIKHLFYKYYSNPKLAFEFNDKEILHKMDFDKFKKITFEMYQKEEREVPNFALLKSVFDYIDIRKDGVIDIQEWTKTFGIVEGKYDLQSNSKQMKALRQWETSNDIISIYKTIAHNKNVILGQLKGMAFKHDNKCFVHEDNLIAILKNIFPLIRLTNTQWKMIVEIADPNKNKLIDYDLFIQLVKHTSQQEKSQPRFR